MLLGVKADSFGYSHRSQEDVREMRDAREKNNLAFPEKVHDKVLFYDNYVSLELRIWSLLYTELSIRCPAY